MTDTSKLILTLQTECEIMVREFEEWANIASDTKELDAQAIVWDAMQRMRATIAVVESILGPKMHAAIDNKEGWVETPVGIYKRTMKGAKYTWDHDEAMKQVVAYALEHREYNASTGEVETELQSVLRHLKKTGRMNYWLYRELKSLKIDADEFREKDPGRPWITSV